MAKLIIEFSKEYVFERANVKNIIEKSDNPADAMVELFTMTSLEKDLNDGVDEITIKRDDMSNDDERQMFDYVFCRVAAVSIVQKVNNEKKNNKENEKEE